MPVLLSLPIPQIPTGIGEYLPIRIPFPFWRIASILPQAVNAPIKASLLALFKLAWSAKLQIPVLITVVFMACDIRLQLEINIFWETNNRNAAAQRRTSTGRDDVDMRRAALLAAAIYQEQRQRLIRQMRLSQIRARQLANSGQGSQRRESLPFPPNAPLALAEDSDLDDPNDTCDEESDDETISCSRHSYSFGSDEDEDDMEDAEDEKGEPARKKKKIKKRSRPSSRELDDDDDDDDEDDSTTTDDEDDEDDDDDDGQDGEGGGGKNGNSSHGNGGNSRYRDAYGPDYEDNSDDGSNNESGGSYGSPLVVEVEIRHRPLFGLGQSQVNDDGKICQKVYKVSFKPFQFFNLVRSYDHDNNSCVGLCQNNRTGFKSKCSCRTCKNYIPLVCLSSNRFPRIIL